MAKAPIISKEEFLEGGLPRSLFEVDPYANVPVKVFISRLNRLPKMKEDSGTPFWTCDFAHKP